MDRIADRDADPAALTGRAGFRRSNLPNVGNGQVRDARVLDTTTDRTPEEARQVLDELRAQQHRRMRGRGRVNPGGD